MVDIMAKSLNDLRKKIKPEIQLAARAKAIDIVAKMTLGETRKATPREQKFYKGGFYIKVIHIKAGYVLFYLG